MSGNFLTFPLGSRLPVKNKNVQNRKIKNTILALHRDHCIVAKLPGNVQNVHVTIPGGHEAMQGQCNNGSQI